MDQSLGVKLADQISQTPRSDQERAIGHKMSTTLSDKLTSRLQGMGFIAQRAAGAPPRDVDVLLIKGHFLSIDQGNRTERVLIGLGMGRSEVQASIQVYESLANGPVLVEQFVGDARSGFKPGMAESMGAGAVADKVGTAAVASGVVAVGSEAFSANIEADASRLADQLARQVGDLYVARGWSPLK